MKNIKYPYRKQTLCARTLARLLTGEHLKHRDADLMSGSYRLSGYVHYLEKHYGWPILRAENVTDTGDPVGRSALYAVYWLSEEIIQWAGKAGQDWANDVLHIEAERIAEREAATSHPTKKECLVANSLEPKHSSSSGSLVGNGGANGSY